MIYIRETSTVGCCFFDGWKKGFHLQSFLRGVWGTSYLAIGRKLVFFHDRAPKLSTLAAELGGNDRRWHVFHWPSTLPIGSMYCNFTRIYHKNQPNVGKHTMHGSHGLYFRYVASSSS